MPCSAPPSPAQIAYRRRPRPWSHIDPRSEAPQILDLAPVCDPERRIIKGAVAAMYAVASIYNV